MATVMRLFSTARVALVVVIREMLNAITLIGEAT
jgi:hypothetical protein